MNIYKKSQPISLKNPRKINKSKSLINCNESTISKKTKNKNSSMNKIKNNSIINNKNISPFVKKKVSRNGKQKSMDTKQNYEQQTARFAKNFQKKTHLQSSLQKNLNPFSKSNNKTIFTNFDEKPQNKNFLYRNKEKGNYFQTNLKLLNFAQTNSFYNNTKDISASRAEETFEDSKEINNFFDDDIRISNGRIFTTVFQIDDLTPIPLRIGEKKHKLAEYDYEEAKRAAVTCRRIEYAYNLRNVIKSEICLNEIIMIQRWWRKMLQKKSEMLLKQLLLKEKIRKENMGNYKILLNIIEQIDLKRKKKKFFKILARRYGKLYYGNLFNNNAAKIQRAVRVFLVRRKINNMLRLQKLFKNYYYHKMKNNIFSDLKEIKPKLEKIIKLQHFIKYYLLKKNEKYYLKSSNNIHPFMYYYLKYGIGANDKLLHIINTKKNKLMNMINKWKIMVKDHKQLRTILLYRNILYILKRKYFNLLILKIAERINAMMTYFLLKPLMKDIFGIYYRNKLFKAIICWKAGAKRVKRNDILGLNIIKKLVSNFTYKPFIKKLKRRKYLNLFIWKLFLYYNKLKKKRCQFSFDRINIHSLKKRNDNQCKREALLRNIIYKKKFKILNKFFNKWKNLVMKAQNNKQIRDYILKNAFININEKNNKILSKYFNRWKFISYKLNRFQLICSFFLRKVIKIVIKNSSKYIFNKIKNAKRQLLLKNLIEIKKKIILKNKLKKYFKLWKNRKYDNEKDKELVKVAKNCRKLIEKIRYQKKLDALKRLIKYKECKKTMLYLIKWKKQK